MLQYFIPLKWSELAATYYRVILGKEVASMNFNVNIDWKFVLALGGAVSGVILSVKISPDSAEKVLTSFVVNTEPNLAITNNSDC